ncbi:hypothetical protein MPSEU_000208000 [Mayamaea pseudoterrestris]|nr:hypothetical protein MPSEU_000208000 [Mayamaea pseudoterrestris]
MASEANTSADNELPPDLKLEDISDGMSERGIPRAKFIDDVAAFAASFEPEASAELLIGAFTDLHSKYKQREYASTQKQNRLKEKLPELEKSLTLITSLLQKKKDGEVSGMTRYSLTDGVYGRAQIDYTVGTVNLWLGANVMLEYTYEDALAFLENKVATAQRDLQDTLEDLALVRDQIVTTEVNMSRVYNWDVKRKRASKDVESIS